MEYEYITSDTSGRKYKVYGGTAYHIDTPDKVVEILDEALDRRIQGSRIRLFFGDSITGKDWNEETGTIGYIGRSSGNIKIPILISLYTSSGGGAILDHCIVKMTRGGKVLYQHPSYSFGDWTSAGTTEKGYKYGVYRDGKIYANFKDNEADKVVNFILFMQGRRNSK